MRLELAIRFKRRYERLMREQGIDVPSRRVAFNIAIPLLEAASLEEEEDLQELFAQLMVNAVNANSRVTILKSFVDVVRTMSTLEARLLASLVDAPDHFRIGHLIATTTLPEQYFLMDTEGAAETPEPPTEVALAVSNLIRNGCLNGASTWDGRISLSIVSITPFGSALMTACRPPPH